MILFSVNKNIRLDVSVSVIVQYNFENVILVKITGTPLPPDNEAEITGTPFTS